MILTRQTVTRQTSAGLLEIEVGTDERTGYGYWEARLAGVVIERLVGQAPRPLPKPVTDTPEPLLTHVVGVGAWGKPHVGLTTAEFEAVRAALVEAESPERRRAREKERLASTYAELLNAWSDARAKLDFALAKRLLPQVEAAKAALDAFDAARVAK